MNASDTLSARDSTWMRERDVLIIVEMLETSHLWRCGGARLDSTRLDRLDDSRTVVAVAMSYRNTSHAGRRLNGLLNERAPASHAVILSHRHGIMEEAGDL